MTVDIKEVLALHMKWLRGEADGVRADLRSADLSYANLRYADLSSADLSSADLSYADLSYADLSYANLSSANLSYANLRSAVGLDVAHLKRRQIVPEVGPFTAFKKLSDNIVAQLEVTGERVGGVLGRKCRASEATVVGFFKTDETPMLTMTEGRSLHDQNFVYRLGEVVKPTEPFDPSMMVECGNGIHFFLSFLEAAEFSL